VANAQCVGFQGKSFDWFVGLVFLLGNEAPVHSFLTNFEQIPDKIFCGLFCYCRM